jgi:mannose-6-phosphate isomerase-like protein (cupin superfamily)
MEESTPSARAAPVPGPQYALADGDGAAYWYLGSLTTVKATGAATGGSFSLIEQRSPVDWGPPRHVHPEDDELIYVLEGSIEYEVGEETFHASAGATVYLPRGVPHAWTTTGETRRLQVTYRPGLEGLFEEMGRPAERSELPPEPERLPGSPAVVEEMAALAPAYGFEVLAPPAGEDG